MGLNLQHQQVTLECFECRQTFLAAPHKHLICPHCSAAGSAKQFRAVESSASSRRQTILPTKKRQVFGRRKREQELPDEEKLLKGEAPVKKRLRRHNRDPLTSHEAARVAAKKEPWKERVSADPLISLSSEPPDPSLEVNLRGGLDDEDDLIAYFHDQGEAIQRGNPFDGIEEENQGADPSEAELLAYFHDDPSKEETAHPEPKAFATKLNPAIYDETVDEEEEFDPDDPWEEDEGLSLEQRSKERWVIGVAVALGLVVAISTIIFLKVEQAVASTRGEETKKRIEDKASVEQRRAFLSEQIGIAREQAQKIYQSQQWQDLLTLIRNPHDVMITMQDYYQKRDFVLPNKAKLDYMDSFEEDGRFFIYFLEEANSPKMRHVIMERTSHGFKLDWETYEFIPTSRWNHLYTKVSTDPTFTESLEKHRHRNRFYTETNPEFSSDQPLPKDGFVSSASADVASRKRSRQE